jgi:hypothetical protein
MQQNIFWSKMVSDDDECIALFFPLWHIPMDEKNGTEGLHEDCMKNG